MLNGAGMPQPITTASLVQRISALERQLADQDGTRRLEAATISKGGLRVRDGGGITIADGGSLTVTDTTGTPQIRLGKMSVGGYGLEARDPTSGQWVPLSALASAQKSAATTDSIALAAPANGSTAWLEYGPGVTVTTYTGRLTVDLSAKLDLTGNKATLAASWIIYRTGTAVLGASMDRGLALTFDAGGMGVNIQAGFSGVHTVTPGTYSVVAAYRLWSGAAEASHGTVANRTITVRPD